jgi:Cu+-exporting ATPase
VWRDEQPVGLLGAFDALKEGSAEAIRRLRSWGLEVAVVSGDRVAAVQAIARHAGVDRAVGEVFPEGKVAEVRRLQETGKRVAFVGDGVNDAPALAQADLGIALGTGTDVAMEAGDVLILGGDLRLVGDALALARRTFAVIAQNLAWAFAYNLLMIPLAVAGKVSPMVAAGAMAGSSVTVVGNALRLLRYGGLPLAPETPEAAEVELAGAEPALTLRAGDPDPAAGPELAEPPVEVPVSRGGFVRQEARRIARALGRLYERQWEI